MKKYIALFLIFIIVLSLCFAAYSYADPGVMTASELAAAAFALGQGSGLNFTFDNSDSAYVKSWMESKVDSWLAGDTIAEKIGYGQLQMIAGKLVIGQHIYQGVKDFVEFLVDDMSISNTRKEVDKGHIGDIVVDKAYFTQQGSEPGTGISCYGIGEYKTVTRVTDWNGIYYNEFSGWTELVVYYNGNYVGTLSRNGHVSMEWRVIRNGNRYEVESRFVAYGSSYQPWIALPTGIEASGTVEAQLTNDYELPTVGTGYQWEGTVADAPDTNLEQLLQGIIDNAADNNLSVEGEVTEAQPQPTPAPTIPPVEPGDIDGYWNRQAGQMEGLGNDIGDISGHIDDMSQGIDNLGDTFSEGLDNLGDTFSQGLDNIGDQVGAQTDAITGAQEATTEAVESLTGVIEGALDTPSTQDLPQFKFDLRELFPFCIPFDIYRLLSSFDATPQAPHVRLPIVIQSIGFNYTLDLDFSAWNPVAQAMRTAELIVYAIGLAWATGKVIKW